MHMIYKIVHLVELFMFEAFPCMILPIMMPFSLMQEYYIMLTAGTYQIMRFCHFFLHLMCALFGHEVYICFEIHHAIFTVVQALYFCDLCGD